MFRPTLRAAFAAMCVLLAGAAARAQTDDITQHYRAYRAALERNDLPAAAREAQAALAASEARDGDGGVTAVLAFNLAQTRLDAGEGAQAVGPAQRALALAQTQTGGTRVDPLAAQILLGRAQLAANESGARDRLRAALDQAAPLPAYQTYAFDAARDLARATQGQDARQAIAIWDIALQIAVARDSPLWRAQALIGRGDALIELEINDFRRRLSGNAPPRANDAAWNTFAEARALLEPHVRAAPNDGRTTNAQLLYAQSLAYLGVVRAMRYAANGDNRAIHSLTIDNMPEDGAPPCAFRMRFTPEPDYPAGALMRFGVGGVGVRMRTDETGQVVEAAVLASVGGAIFTEAVNAVAPQWRAEFEQSNAPCSRSVVVYVPGAFMMSE